MKHHPMYQQVHNEAKQLRKAVKAADPSAIAIIRKAFPVAAPDDDADLIKWAKLVRVQHAYAVDKGYEKWNDLLEEKKLDWADSLIADNSIYIEDSDEFGSAIAETNANTFTVDHYEINKIKIDKDGYTHIHIDWSATAMGHRDAPFCGDKVSGFAILFFGEGECYWEEISASVDDWREPDDDLSDIDGSDGPGVPTMWDEEKVPDWSEDQIDIW